MSSAEKVRFRDFFSILLDSGRAGIMYKHTSGFILIIIGVVALLFSLVRIYYVMWRNRKEQEEIYYRRLLIKKLRKRDSDSED